MAGILAHIPCCGSQFLVTVVGMQVLGILSSRFVYQYQFYSPLIITLAISLYHIWKHKKLGLRDILKFFITNLAICYAVVGILYLFIPPHDHLLIRVKTEGVVDQNHKAVTVIYHDEKRSWPWSKRIFVASYPEHGANMVEAQEKFWYQFRYRNENQIVVPAELIARPGVMWGQTSKTLPKYFIRVDQSK